MDTNQENKEKKLTVVQKISTAMIFVCIIVFFVLLEYRPIGYWGLSFPGVLAIGAFFSGLSYTGTLKGALRYLGFLLLLFLFVVIVSLLARYINVHN